MIAWLRVNLSRIGSDIRRGENLEVYVTMLVATFVLIASIAGYDRFTVPAVLAVLLLITFSQLSYKKFHEKQQQDLEDIRKAITQPDSGIGAEVKPNNKPDGPPPPLERYNEDSVSMTHIASELGGEAEHIELVSKASTASHDRYTVRLLKNTFSYNEDYRYPLHKEGDVFVAVVHRQTRSLVSVSKMNPTASDVTALSPPSTEPSGGIACVLSILLGGTALYLAVQLRNVVEMTYAVYGTDALEIVPGVVIFTTIAILLIPPFAFIQGATAGQPPRIQYGYWSVLFLIPAWAIMAIWLSLIPFQSQLTLDRSEHLTWLVESAKSFRSTYFVSSTVDSAASATSEILVHGIVAVIFGFLTVTVVFIVGEVIHFFVENQDALWLTVFFIWIASIVIAAYMMFF